nr:D-alanine--D-alanine ligase [Muribaculaceae bacterium]
MKTTVAVFFGGRSTEHEISVISASQAMHAINRDRFDVVPVYISKQGHWYTGDALLDVKNYRDMKQLLSDCEEVYMRPIYGDTNLYKVRKPMFGSDVVRRIDVVIPVLHGANGEDGTFEGFLEQCGVPYAGCNTLASANGMDKITMKQILSANGIPVVDYEWFTDQQWHSRREELLGRIEKNLGYPVIVKPANLGSSVGISSAHNREELIDAVNEAQRYSTRLIVEHMVKNLKEINCSVLGDADEFQTSVLEEPIKSGDFLSYEEKYLGGGGGKGAVKGGAKNSRRGMASS